MQLETHRKRSYRKAGERPKPKPRQKHLIKVHVMGLMNAEFYVSINFYNSVYFPFYKANSLTKNTNSCKTTIPNTFLEELRPF